MKKFLAGVGTAVLFGNVGGNFVPVAHVKTLTESTLSITSTQEEIRAGEGAMLYGRFSHDAGMTVTLTDAMFDLNYIAWQVGEQIEQGGIDMYTETVTVKSEDTKLKLSKTPNKISEACGFDKTVVWYREAGCQAGDSFKLAKSVADGYMVQDEDKPTASNPKDFCVYYFANNTAAHKVLVRANFIPAELSLVLTTKLFAGSATNVEAGKPAGHITVKIPRFVLDGAFDLSMAMSSPATMAINGTALATSDGTCDDKGIYAEIVEVVEDTVWYQDLKRMVVDDEGMELEGSFTADELNGKTFIVYGINQSSAVPYLIDNELLSFTKNGTGVNVSEKGVITIDTTVSAGSYVTIAVKPITVNDVQIEVPADTALTFNVPEKQGG